MKTKNIIIIALVAILLIVAGAVFSSGILKNDERITTPFKTEFMEGNFTGHVKLVNDSEKFMHSYEDHENNITLFRSTAREHFGKQRQYVKVHSYHPLNQLNIYLSRLDINGLNNLQLLK